MKRLLVFVLLVAACGIAAASPPVNAAWAVWDSSVRIATPDGLGSGVVYATDASYVYVLTNKHVVGQSQAVNCCFYNGCRRSHPVAGTVVRVFRAADIAVIRVGRAVFGKGPYPRVMPIAHRNPQPGVAIYSVGYPKGCEEQSGFHGQLLRYEQCGAMIFQPPPANGRSGSAIVTLDTNGPSLVGLLNARDDNAGEGLAVTVEVIRACIDGKLAEADVPKNISFAYQTWEVGCGPGGCGPQGCTPDGMYGGGGIFGGRGRQQQEQPSPYAWGPPAAAPDTGVADALKAIADGQKAGFNAIADKLATPVTPTMPIMPIAPVAPSGPDPMTKAALDQNAADIQGVDKKVTKGLKEQGEKIESVDSGMKKVAENQAQHGTLLERIAAAQHQVQQEEPNAPKIKQDVDTLKELIANGKGGLWVLGIVAAVAFGVLHLMRTGKTIGTDAIDRLAAARPNDQHLQDLKAKMDGFSEKLASHFPHASTLAAIGAAGAGTLAGGGPALVAAAIPQALADVTAELARLHAKVDNVQATTQATQVHAAVAAANTAPVAQNQ